jgi:hypothetical protein
VFYEYKECGAVGAALFVFFEFLDTSSKQPKTMLYSIHMKETLLSRSYMVAVLAVISVIGLIVGKQILIPVALSLFLSLTLSPLVEWLHK